MAGSRSRRRKQRRRAPAEYRSPQPSRSERAAANIAADDEARAKAARRKVGDDRPPAPWGSFPLQEITVFAGIVILIVGLVQNNPKLIVVGVGLGCLGGLELTLREHLAGFKSHSALLAGVVFVLLTGGLYYYAGLILLICLIIGAAAFTGTFFWMRAVFRRASGGLSYKV